MSQHVIDGYITTAGPVWPVWNFQTGSWDITSAPPGHNAVTASPPRAVTGQWPEPGKLKELTEHLEKLVDERNNEAIDKLNFRILKVRRKLSEAITD